VRGGWEGVRRAPYGFSLINIRVRLEYNPTTSDGEGEGRESGEKHLGVAEETQAVVVSRVFGGVGGGS